MLGYAPDAQSQWERDGSAVKRDDAQLPVCSLLLHLELQMFWRPSADQICGLRIDLSDIWG
jgi:hypothetical protein